MTRNSSFPAFALALLAAGAFAGCVTAPANDCEGEDCPADPGEPTGTPMIERDPGLPWPSIPANESLRSLRFEDCEGYTAAFEIPFGTANEHAPPGFTAGMFHGRGVIFVDGTVCGRAVLNHTVIEDVSFTYFALIVDTENETWEDVAAPVRFVFDFIVDNEAIHSFLTRLGFKVTLADFAINDVGTPLAVREWDVSWGENGFSFAYAHQRPIGQSGNSPGYLYFGDRVYARLNFEKSWDQSDAPEVIPVRLSGSWATKDVVGQDVFPAILSPEVSKSFTFVVDEDLYYA